MKWPLKDDWVPEASFERRREAGSRDAGGKRCGRSLCLAHRPHVWRKWEPQQEKAMGQKCGARSLPTWEFVLSGQPGRFFTDRTETEAWVWTVVRTSVFCFVLFLSDVEPFQGLEQRSGMN